MATVTVRYVNGAEVTASPEAWPTTAADGVDHVDLHVAPAITYRMQGHSIYWLRRVDGRWAVGGGTVGDGQIVEVVNVDGRFEQRFLEHMPDLLHSAVKLGWWEP